MFWFFPLACGGIAPEDFWSSRKRSNKGNKKEKQTKQGVFVK
jgi:hypothetical protein